MLSDTDKSNVFIQGVYGGERNAGYNNNLVEKIWDDGRRKNLGWPKGIRDVF